MAEWIRGIENEEEEEKNTHTQDTSAYMLSREET